MMMENYQTINYIWKLVFQCKVLAGIKSVIAFIGLVMMFGCFPIIYFVNQKSVFETPEKHPIFRQIAESSVSEIFGMFLVPFFYFGAELGIGIWLYISSSKLDRKRLYAWLCVTGASFSVGLAAWTVGIFSLGFHDFSIVFVISFVNFTVTAYSLIMTFLLMRGINDGNQNQYISENLNNATITFTQIDCLK